MNQFNNSETSILTHPVRASNHGKKISAIAMDVDNDGQRIADRIQDKDLMDTTLDNPQEASSNAADPVALAKGQVAAGTEPTPVAENSSEKDDRAQQSSKPMRKTPH